MKDYTGEAITVSFDSAKCRHYGECVRGLPQVFDVSARPWIQVDAAAAELVAEVVRRCPSGALRYRRADGSGEPPQRPTSVTAVPGGPVLLRGELELDVDGVRTAETRLAVCACGRSARRPLCDASCESS